MDRYRDDYHEDIDHDSVREYARNLERDDDIDWDREKLNRRNFRRGKYNVRNRASTRRRYGLHICYHFSILYFLLFS